jgi:preprotein translocase subunit SecA
VIRVLNLKTHVAEAKTHAVAMKTHVVEAKTHAVGQPTHVAATQTHVVVTTLFVAIIQNTHHAVAIQTLMDFVVSTQMLADVEKLEGLIVMIIAPNTQMFV